jgi:hypothetical protein
MDFQGPRIISKFLFVVLFFVSLSSVFCPSVFAQEPTTLLASAAVEPAPAPVPAISLRVPEARINEHKFLDRKNQVLFVAVTALDFADFGVTRMNLQNGGQELNPLTRPFTGSTGMLAMNFAGETVGVIGLSYFFHKTGHHKLERLTSMVTIATSSTAVGYGLSHR